MSTLVSQTQMNILPIQRDDFRAMIDVIMKSENEALIDTIALLANPDARAEIEQGLQEIANDGGVSVDDLGK